MIEQGYDSVSDQAGRGVVPGDHELEQGGQQLLRGERVVFGGDQDADQVVGRVAAFGVDQLAQVGDDAVRRLYRLRRGVTGPAG